MLAVWAMLASANSGGAEDDGIQAGPLAQEFRLTLEPGRRFEALGPFYFEEEAGDRRSFGMPPLFSWTTDAGIDGTEFDILYPLFTSDRYGSEYRWHIFQLFSFAGGRGMDDEGTERFTLFPIYFRQRSDDPARNYTAFLPFYGHLKQRLLRDEIFFAMYPLYIQTRRKDVVTDNYLYPVFHLRHGNGLDGWQFWPLVGSEHKAVTTRTNDFGESIIIGGHEKFFALWPFYNNTRTGIGTENPEQNLAVLPFYSAQRSPLRDSTTVVWPFFTFTEDRRYGYREWDMPWPLIVFARPTGQSESSPYVLRRAPARFFGAGDGKTVNRIFPFFGQAYNESLRSEFYVWPIYKRNRIHAPPLERDRLRLLLFLYSDLTERNLDTGKALRRVDLWPLFTSRVDREGRERLQILSILEPILPGNKSTERNFSPLWSLWRSEKNAATGARSESLLWNLYRREVTPESKKYSLLFGLFQYQNTPDGVRRRLFYIPSAGPGRPLT